MTDTSSPAVLLVDDDELVLSGLVRVLRSTRLPVLVAPRAEQAMALMETHEVGVIVCEPHDERLATFLIDARHNHPSVARVILTGYPKMDSVLKVVNDAHPFKLLTKPWADEELRSTVEKALALYGVSRQRDQIIDDFSTLRASTERAHAVRALGAVTQSTPHDATERTIAAMAVGALLLRNDFLIHINAAAQRLLITLGASVPVVGVQLPEMTGAVAGLVEAAHAQPLVDGCSQRAVWRGPDGQRLDFFVKHIGLGCLVTFVPSL